jgi:hypothetical protein
MGKGFVKSNHWFLDTVDISAGDDIREIDDVPSCLEGNLFRCPRFAIADDHPFDDLGNGLQVDGWSRND